MTPMNLDVAITIATGLLSREIESLRGRAKDARKHWALADTRSRNRVKDPARWVRAAAGWKADYEAVERRIVDLVAARRALIEKFEEAARG